MNRIKLLVILSGLTLCLASCSKSSDDPQKSVSIKDVIPSTLLNDLKNRMNIYDGDTPPSIDGSYLISPAVLVSTTLLTDSCGDIYVDNYIKFTNQNKNNVVAFNSYEDGSHTSSSNSLSICGTGRYFTAYLTDYEVSTTDGYTATSATVISGEKVASGIRNIRYAFLMISKNDPNDDLVPVNTIRVFADKDSLATNAIWPETKAFYPVHYTYKGKLKY